ncbi:13095_t:CDS:10 [Entrophospora sp. SA101]|nr:13095_t:CDS:10 [Entrophospora sp. SA101]
MTESRIKTSVVVSHGTHASSCGYCDSYGRSIKFAFTAYLLTCQDYQDLIDRGWRRENNIGEENNNIIITEGTYNPFDKDDVSDVDNTDNNKAKQQQSNKKPTKTFDIIESIHESEKIEGKHRFKIVLEKSSFTKEKYQLYFKYQTNVHDDKEYEVSESGFRRFLYEPSSKPNTPGYGSFHQCYYLDDKLIAVAVLDILPSCISSVYFFYDNDYSAMQLGKYSALREIAMTLELYNEGLKDLQWYYMGYYIYSCQKMKYKEQYKPSYLLDPVTYEWYPIEKFTPQFEKTKFVTFSNISTSNTSLKSMLDPRKVTDNDISDLKLFINGEIIPFRSSFIKSTIIKNKLKNFYAAVGRELAIRMVNVE